MGERWQRFGSGLPNVPVMQTKIIAEWHTPRVNRLAAALWRLPTAATSGLWTYQNSGGPLREIG